MQINKRESELQHLKLLHKPDFQFTEQLATLAQHPSNIFSAFFIDWLGLINIKPIKHARSNTWKMLPLICGALCSGLVRQLVGDLAKFKQNPEQNSSIPSHHLFVLMADVWCWSWIRINAIKIIKNGGRNGCNAYGWHKKGCRDQAKSCGAWWERRA